MSAVSYDAELNTQQAADYLNVSRPYLVHQLETGHILYKKVGRHRRVRFCDLVTYEKEARDKPEQALADLNAEAKRLGLE